MKRGLNQTFILIVDIWNYEKHAFIVLNVRDGTESKYPSNVFLCIYEHNRIILQLIEEIITLVKQNNGLITKVLVLICLLWVLLKDTARAAHEARGLKSSATMSHTG